MFIYTAKLQRKRIIVGACALVAFCALFAFLAGFHSLWGAQSISVSTAPRQVKTNEDRIAYLEQLGWSCGKQADSVEELLIPAQFDESHADYLQMQSEQGFSLDQYAGKRAKRYAYTLQNHPNGGAAAASLLVYKGKVIAGEVYRPDTGEVLHGLDRPS